MKRRPIPWHILLLAMGFLLALLLEGCGLGKDARVTTVYGKITDQAGLPIDSMTVIMFGGKGLSSGGVPIGETKTNSEGQYELVVDVPKAYSRVDAILHFEYQSLLDKYYEQLVFQDGVRRGSCCKLSLGRKTNYDFVMLPK